MSTSTTPRPRAARSRASASSRAIAAPPSDTHAHAHDACSRRPLMRAEDSASCTPGSPDLPSERGGPAGPRGPPGAAARPRGSLRHGSSGTAQEERVEGEAVGEDGDDDARAPGPGGAAVGPHLARAERVVEAGAEEAEFAVAARDRARERRDGRREVARAKGEDDREPQEAVDDAARRRRWRLVALRGREVPFFAARVARADDGRDAGRPGAR